MTRAARKEFKRNLIIGFGLSLILLLVSAIASLISIRNLLNSQDLVSNTNQVITELHFSMKSLTDAETGQRGFLLTNDRMFLEPYEGAAENVKTTLKNIRTLTADDAGQQENVDELERVVNRRLIILQGLIDDKIAGKPLNTVSLELGRQLMAQAREIIDGMVNHEEMALAERTKDLNSFATRTPVLIVTAALLSLLVTIVFFLRVNGEFIRRSRLQTELEEKDKEIRHRIHIIEEVAATVSSGDYSVRLSEDEQDNLGNLAHSLNQMAESLESSFTQLSDREWLQTGIAELNEKIRGELSVKQLTENIIQFVSEYADCQTGAIYLNENNTLFFNHGYAYFPSENKMQIRIGEGITGQALAGRKPILIENLEPGSLHLEVAEGTILPAHIIAFPIYFENRIKGVIELASIHSFEKKKLDFFHAVSHSVGILINNAKNRQRLQELLAQTKSQAEELKAQHSELENINAELEAQTEKLQVSEEELKVQHEELEQANAELEERTRLLEEKNQLISERNREVQHKAEQLEISTRYKSEFLANMSHELRTPLNSILLLSRLLSENTEKNLSRNQVEYAEVIQSSGRGLLQLIDEILDLSKIESGKMELEFNEVDINTIVNNLKSMFQPMADVKKLQLDFAVEESTPAKIKTDILRLEQILKNLLSNAIKFTANGSVKVLIAGRGNQIEFSVKDTGIGIPSEKQDIIFDAFQQADGSTRRKYGGTGLGLSISRELVRLLGGAITVNSEAGKGSIFTVTIPLTPPSETEARDQQGPADNANNITGLKAMPPDQEQVKQQERYLAMNIPDPVADDRSSISKNDQVILIIDDDTSFAKSLLNFTREKGYKGLVAVRGDEGIELARQFKPLGILLDIQLPVKDGWQVMEELKQDPETRHIPVHIMSSQEFKRKSISSGAIDFINKPVAFEQVKEIFDKIEHVLSRETKKVLIVEENPKHAKALAYFLETFNVTSEIKTEAQESIDALKNDDVDCVILDMGIPDQKAYDTLEAVKKASGLENIPIIIFTGKSLSKAEEARIKQYADSIVIKTAHSYKRIFDEVSLFLHLMETNKKTSVRKDSYKNLGKLNEVLKDKSVLIVDDDVRNIFSLSKALEPLGVKVITAIDGKDALKQLEAHPATDLVLMDMMMPEMDGYEATAMIRKNYRYRNLPIIAVTAKAMTGDREKCISAGASDYITKPVDIDQLLSLLRVWLYE